METKINPMTYKKGKYTIHVYSVNEPTKEAIESVNKHVNMLMRKRKRRQD
nr:hypothetical protein 37 [Bacillaceae bacterium]